MAKSKIISASIAVDIQNLQEVAGAVQGLSSELSNMQVDKNLEPRLKNVERTLAGAVKQINAMTDKIDMLSKIKGIDPKVVHDLSLLSGAIADVKVEVDALSSKFNNFSKGIGDVKDVGIKQVTTAISKEIGDMSENISASIDSATKTIQAGGEKLKKAYEQILDSINAEIDEKSLDISKIFKISDEDDFNDQFEKIKDKLEKDLKSLAEATNNYNNIKISGGGEDELIKAAKAQASALEKLKESFQAFYSIDDLSDHAGEDVTKKMTASINEVIKSFPNLQGEVYRTFDEIYDFIDAITENITNDFTASINTIKSSLKGVSEETKEPTKKASTDAKTKAKSVEKSAASEVNANVSIKEGVGAELIAELKTVINDLQKYANTHPVELDAIINPTWGTAQTRKYLKSIKEQLSKTKDGQIDEKLAARIYGLQDAFGADFSEALNKAIQKLKDSVGREGFSVGKITIDDSAVKELREQISNEIGAITVDINANILGTTVVDKDKTDAINKQYEELRNSESLDPNKVMDLVKAIKESGANLDYSDAYKDRLKQIVKGLVEGIYGSVPEAIRKTRYPEGTDPLKMEFNGNSARIKELVAKVNGGATGDALIYYKDQIEKLLERQRTILANLSQNVAEETPLQVEESIKDATQQINAATIDVTTATINIANAEIPSISTKNESVKEVESAPAAVEEVAQKAEATLGATHEELVKLANARFNELLKADEVDFKGIEKLVADLRKAGINNFNEKYNTTTVGRTVNAMLKGGYTSALEAFKSTTSHSVESKIKAQNAQLQHTLHEGFMRLYDKVTVQEKGTGSIRSIQAFVDKVRKSGYDFKVDAKHQDNEIGKLINTVLTEGYAKVSDAVESKKSNASQEIKSTSQRIENANINISKATINVKNGKGNVGETKGVAKQTTEEDKTSVNKLQKLIEQYNKNISQKDTMSLDQYLKRQEKLLIEIAAIKNSNNDVLSDSESVGEGLRANKEAVKRATEAIDKLLSAEANNSPLGRYKLFNSKKIYQTKDLHELEYALSGDRYQNGYASTLLQRGVTSPAKMNAYTTEKIHNHPSGTLAPSLSDISSWFSDLALKKSKVHSQRDNGVESKYFDKYISSIVALTSEGVGTKMSFDMSKFLSLNNKDRDALKDKLLYGLIATEIGPKTLKANQLSALNYLTGGALSKTRYTPDGKSEKIEVSDLSEKSRNVLDSLIEYLKQNLDLNDVRNARANGHGGDYKYLNDFKADHVRDLEKIAAGEVPSIASANEYISKLKGEFNLDDSAQGDTSKIQKYLDQINDLISSTTDEVLQSHLEEIRVELENNYSIVTTPINVSNLDSEAINQAQKDLRSNVVDLANTFTTLKEKTNQVNGYLKDIENINTFVENKKVDPSKLSSNALTEYNKSFDRLKELQTQLSDAITNNDYSDIDISKIEKEIESLRKSINESIKQTIVSDVDIKGLIRKIDNLQIDEVKTDPAIMSRVKQIRKDLSKALDNDAEEMLTEKYNDLKAEISKLSGTVSKSDRTFFGNFMKEWRHKNFQMLAQFFSFYDIVRYMREAVNVVKQYDNALIEMMKVSDETRSSLEKYQKTVFDTADAIGSSALTLNQSTADWMRIGESLTEAAKSAKAAQVLMNVSEFQDINSATQALVSASQAYADLDKMDIVDKINKLGNEFPIATDQLATALQNSAAALTTQGNDINEALALVVGGNIITQDALKTGTGIRTIALRIAGTKEAKDELAELGEGVDDFIVRTESKTRKLIMDYTAVASNGFKGVDVYDKNGNLRSTYEILQDIADIYKEIQSEDKQAGTNRANALVELLAGKNRSNIAASILTNPDTIREAYEAAQNAEGSAMRENEKYLTSVEAHMTQFKNAVDQLVNDLVDSGFINEIIDFGTKFINILDEIVNRIGGFGTLLTAIMAIVGGKNGFFGNLLDSTTLLIKNFTTLKKTLKGLKGSVTSYAEAEALLAQETELASGATITLGAALKTVGIGLAIGLVMAIVSVISKIKEEIREAIDAVHDFAKEVQNQNESLKDYAKRISEANKIIHDENSTTEEISNAKNNLIDIQNELNESYDNFSNVIQNVNDSLKEENELLVANRQAKLRDVLYEAKNTKSEHAENEYQRAINAFEYGNEDTYTYLGVKPKSAYVISRLKEYGANRFNSNFGEGREIQFRSTGNIDEDIKILYQIRDSIEEVDDIDAETINYLTDLIGAFEKQRDENKDIYLAYGETQAAEKFNNEYLALMEAYLFGTEEEMKDGVAELWNAASDETDRGIRYWLDSMFSAYTSELKEIDINDEVLAAATNLAGTAHNGRRDANSYKELSYEDVLSGLNGNYRSNLDSTQKQYIDELKNAFINAGITDYNAALDAINLFKHDERITFEKDLKDARNEAISRGMSSEDFNNLGIGTYEELNKWNEIAKATDNATDRVRMYILATSGIGETTDASEILSNMQEQYKPAFDALAESYKAIWSDSGFDIGKVTAEQINAINTQIKTMSDKLKEEGYDGISDDLIDDFILKLSSVDVIDEETFGTDKAKEVQQAYDDLATEIVNNLAPAIGQASGETAQLIQKQLTELGVTNAEDVVMSRLGYTAESYANAKKAASEINLDLDSEVASLDEDTLELIANNEALMDYYRGRILANSIDINTEDDVNALLRMCDALNIAKIGSLELAKVQKDLVYANSLMAQGITQNSLSMQRDAKKIIDETIAAVQNAGKDAGVEWEPVKYDGNKTISSSTSSGSESKQKFDWIERAIKKIQRAVTNLGKVADATYKNWSNRLDAIMGKTEEFHDELGRFGQGNIDLYNRPRYMNEDGSISTVRSMSFGDEFGNEILIPTIAFDNNGNPYSMSDDEAIARYYETGEHLGLFKSIEEAEEYAEKLHEQQEALYVNGGNTFYAGKYQKLKEEIALQEQAAAAYMAEANAIGLAAEYKNKVMNGMMDIETVTNETLKEQISDFQDLYDKSLECSDSIEDLKAEIAAIAQTKFDYITKQFEEMALAIDHAATRIGHIQSKMDAKGYFESSTLIEQLIIGDEDKLKQLEQKAAALAKSIDEAVTNGDIEYGSEQWWGMWDSLQSVNDEIVEMSSSLADLNDQLRQMNWDNFDYISDAVNRLVDENEFLIEVLQDEEQMFEKNAYIGEDMYANGNMSDAALAVQGLHVNNLKILQEQNKKYAKEVENINRELANDPNNKKLLERRNELIDQQQDIIKGISDEKHAIKDLIQEGYETFLDYLQKSIDKRKEILEAQKSLYDYEKNIKEQTKAIASYQKQLAALGGDTSEENQAHLQELADSLNKAEEDLQESEYERWLSDQEEMMDNMYSDFEKLINDKLDNVDELIMRAIDQTAQSATDISRTIQDEADEFLYNLDNTSFGVNMDMRMSDAVSAVHSVEDAINTMINAANINAQNELAQLQSLAQTVATQAAAKASQIPQVNPNTGGNGGTSGTTPSGTVSTSEQSYNKQTNTENSRRIRELNEQKAGLTKQYNDMLATVEKYKNLAASASNTADRAQAYTNVNYYQAKANSLKNSLDKVIEDLKSAQGFAKGGVIGNAIKRTGEDGIILARSGEEVLSVERVKQMQQVFKLMQPLSNVNSVAGMGGNTTVNGMNVVFDLPNVTSYEDFVNKAQKDPRFERLVQSVTIGNSLGKSKLSKYSI